MIIFSFPSAFFNNRYLPIKIDIVTLNLIEIFCFVDIDT